MSETAASRDARTGGPRRGPNGLRFRPARPDDLGTCREIWRDGLDGYMVPLNLPPVPAEVGSVGRLHAHLLATDPERFVVAARPGKGGRERLVGFASAVRRDEVWFLSMLFVRPEEQRSGVGRALLDEILPRDGPALATATDAIQPISNALYASLGIVPRMPLFSLVGRPAGDALGSLPAGVSAVPFDEIDDVAAAVAELDREILGFSHPQDHAFARLEGRRGFLYRGPDGSVLGYGCASDVGRVGPIAVRDEALLPAVLGHLLAVFVPRGASAVWVPGAADRAMVPLLRAGLRLDAFPVLLCWSRPFADFARYLPHSPGLL